MRVKAVAREVGIFGLFLLLAIAFTWPLVVNLGTALSDLGDPLLNTWILDWDLYAFAHNPLHLYDASIYAPAKYPLAYSENMVGVALVIAPFKLLGVTPVALYNIAMLLGFAMSGYGMSVLARTVGRSTFAALIAGVLFAFCSFKFEHLAHLQIIWSGWLPLLFAALFVFWHTPSWLHAAFVAVAFAMNGLTNIHWLLFGSFAFALTAVFLAVVHPRRDFRFWIRLAAALIVACLVLLPFLLPYRTVADLYGMRRVPDEVEGGSAIWSDWLVATSRNLLWGPLWLDVFRPERRLFPGGVALALAIAGFFFVRRGDRQLPLIRPSAAGTAGSAGGPSLFQDSRGKGISAPEDLDSHATHAPTGTWIRFLLPFLDLLIVLFCVEAYLGATGKFLWHEHGRLIVSIDNASTPLVIAIVLAFIRCTIRLPFALGGSDGSNLGGAVARSRFTAEEWSAAVWIGVGVLGSLGLHAFLHSFLYSHVGVFQSTRTPARWAIIAYVGFAVWSAIGVDAILRRPQRWRRIAAQVVIALLAVADVTPRIRWEHVVAEPAPVYRWLATSNVRGSVLELPMSGWNLPFPYVLTSTVHHVPIMNGTSGFEPPLHAQLRDLTEHGRYDDALTTMLEANGCQLIVVHGDWLSTNVKPVCDWIRRGLATGRLSFLRRFDGGLNGDYVFALRRNAAGTEHLRSGPGRDTAGYTEAENLERFLSGQMTYSSTIFGRDETPRADEEIHGQMTVSGWTLAPDGIARVTVRIHSGKYRFAATLMPRPDVSALYPWYPNTPNPGFIAVLPKRPKGMPRMTDVQVEIADHTGHVMRLPDRILTWD